MPDSGRILVIVGIDHTDALLSMLRHANHLSQALLAAILVGVSGCATTPPPSLSFADETASPLHDGPITMDAAVRHALATDPSVRAARHLVSAASWVTVQASLPANPSAGVSLDSTWSASLAALLMDWMDVGSRRSQRVAMAQSREEQALLAVLQREADLSRRVQSAFVEVVTARRLEVHYAERGEVLEQAFRVEQRRHEWGDVSELELIRLERAHTSASSAQADEAMRRRQAEARLNRYLGLSLRQSLELIEPGEPAADGLYPESLDEIDLGRVNRPELSILAAQAAALDAEWRLAKVAWLPDLEAGPILEWPRSGSAAVYGGGAVTMTLPVLDHGQARRGAVQERLRALEQTMLETQAEILLEVHDAWLRFRRARQREQVHARKEHEQAMRQRLLTEELLSAGAASQMDVWKSRVDELNAGITLEEARREAWLAWIELSAALGNPTGAARGIATAERAFDGQH